MKEKLLFVIDSLDCAGAEKSLVTLLSLLDYSKYSVDLMLFAHGGLLEEFVPKEVNIIKPINYTKFTQFSLGNSFLFSLKNCNFSMFFSRMKFTLRTRFKKYDTSEKARVYWECVSNSVENNSKEYDVAISYSQGIPTFYVASKVKAKKKFTWVNISFRLKNKDKIFHRKYYEKFNGIVTVSDSAKDIFLETYPNFTENVKIIYDINDPKLITSMSNLEDTDVEKYDGVKILTIGRLVQQKGFDIAIETCIKLKEMGIKFKWYVLGNGPLKNEIEELIENHNLQDYFILLGVKSNPYPYIKNADIYVQTSKYEGFGLAIAEARILNIPVVTTRFDAVYNQMVEGKNGLVVEMNGNAVCEGIVKVIKDQQLRENIVNYLKHEEKGNVKEIEKFYHLIGCTIK